MLRHKTQSCGVRYETFQAWGSSNSVDDSVGCRRRCFFVPCVVWSGGAVAARPPGAAFLLIRRDVYIFLSDARPAEDSWALPADDSRGGRQVCAKTCVPGILLFLPSSSGRGNFRRELPSEISHLRCGTGNRNR